MTGSASGVDASMRRGYLRTMGIQTWVSRVELPGAKARQVSIAEDCSEARPAQPKTESLQVLLQTDTAVVATEQEVATLAPSRSQVVEEKPRFRLVSLLCPGQCLLMSDLREDSIPEINGLQYRLLLEILNALGVGQHRARAPTYFSWPLSDKQQVDQSREAALEAVQAFIRAQMSGHSLGFVLLMGDVVSRYTLPHEAELEQARGKLWSVRESPALITHSVDTVLADPILKREVWSDIQPLRGLINNNL